MLDELINQRLNFGFRFGRKVTLHIDLADRIPQGIVGEVESSLPSRALFRSAVDVPTNKVEPLRTEALRQKRTGVRDGMVRKPILPRIEHAGPFLPKAFVDERFNFFGKALNGTPEQ